MMHCPSQRNWSITPVDGTSEAAQQTGFRRAALLDADPLKRLETHARSGRISFLFGKVTRRNTMKTREEAGTILVELIIVAAIIVILAAIAYPPYTKHVMRTRRLSCESTMMSAAALLERKHSVMNKYTREGLSLPAQCPGEGARFYDVAFTITESDFNIIATPVAAQRRDQCGALSLTHTGKKGANGTLGGGDVAACW
jgi:type IV pilus assembly protein PilE